MAKKMEKSELGKQADHLIRALQDILGQDEDIVLLAEPDVELFLCVDHPRKGPIRYDVCDGLPGERNNALTFTDLPTAMATYREIRGAGSWSIWAEEQEMAQAKAAIREIIKS